MSKLSDIKVGDVIHSKVQLVAGADPAQYYVVEDRSYEPSGTDGYGDYVPSETTVRVRLLEMDGSYKEDNPEAIISTTWTAGELRVRWISDKSYYNIYEGDLEKLERKMRKVFV